MSLLAPVHIFVAVAHRTRYDVDITGPRRTLPPVESSTNEAVYNAPLR